jgi:ATP-dependent DNA helicase RecG
MELEAKLRELLSLPKETEWVEWKHNNENPKEIGEYLSAISNSAALHRKDRGYIIWGIDDKSCQVVGTSFKPRIKQKGNEELEAWLTRLLLPRIDFQIHEFKYNDKPVVLFGVQPASSMPVRFQGEEYIRIGSSKKKLKDFPEKERELWSILSKKDWSASVIEEATVDDLDPQAIAVSRKRFKEKYPHLETDVDQWDDITFLNKAKLCNAGRITRTAIILLGKSESQIFLSPSVARISWILKDEKGIEKDYQHFDPPLVLAVNQVFRKIRNSTYRYISNTSLFPDEVSQYDPWVIREALHNCIAHQDYTLKGRINVVEEPDSLLLTNLGDFIPGSVERVIERDAPPEYYRNAFLTTAMVRDC